MFLYLPEILLPYRSVSVFHLKQIFSFRNEYTLLAVRTFLSVILWGRTLSFNWNLLLYMLLLSGLFCLL